MRIVLFLRKQAEKDVSSITMSNRFSIFILVACAVTACSKRYSEADVQAAMKHYDQLIKKMDYDSIALTYTLDGQLGNVAHGRDSIRNFLKRFVNVEVLTQESITGSIEMRGDSAIQKGRYRQVAVIARKDTVRPQGTFTAVWLWEDGTLRLKRMATKE
jgi:hypothetical protein